MAKVPRDAWKPGALWRAITSHGHLEAIIMGPTIHYKGKSPYKRVHMGYTSGQDSGMQFQSDYSHSHMLAHFTFTGETRPIPETFDYSIKE